MFGKVQRFTDQRVLREVYKEAALQLLERDCYCYLLPAMASIQLHKTMNNGFNQDLLCTNETKYVCNDKHISNTICWCGQARPSAIFPLPLRQSD